MKTYLTSKQKYYLDKLEYDHKKYNLEYSTGSSSFSVKLFHSDIDRNIKLWANFHAYYGFLEAITTYINFPIVEKIVIPIFKKYGAIGNISIKYTPTIPLSNFTDYFPYIRNESTYKAREVRSEYEMREIINEYNSYIKNVATPFIGFFKDIRNLLPYLEDHNILYKRLYPVGALQKKIVIWKLCNHPKYFLFKEEYLSLLEERGLNNIGIERLYNITKELYDILERIDPIYEWDESFLYSFPV